MLPTSQSLLIDTLSEQGCRVLWLAACDLTPIASPNPLTGNGSPEIRLGMAMFSGERLRPCLSVRSGLSR